jgi:hypothetical protein
MPVVCIPISMLIILGLNRRDAPPSGKRGKIGWRD